MNATHVAFAALALVVACGGETPAAESAPAPAPPPVQAPSPDRIAAVLAADSGVKPNADTSKKAAATGDHRMRDSAFGPKYAVDSTGKVTKIKKP